MTITDWIKKIWKRVGWDGILGIILAITIIAMIIAVARKGQTLDNALLAGLIAVTTWYAYATIKIARATKQQADASVKMAISNFFFMILPPEFSRCVFYSPKNLGLPLKMISCTDLLFKNIYQ